MQNIVLGENMYRKGLFRGILFAVLGCLAWTYAAAKPIDVLVFYVAVLRALPPFKRR